jgi:hypothetical protein
MRSLAIRRTGVKMYNPIQELRSAVAEMKAAGLTRGEMAMEFLGAVLVFSPILLMFL